MGKLKCAIIENISVNNHKIATQTKFLSLQVILLWHMVVQAYLADEGNLCFLERAKFYWLPHSQIPLNMKHLCYRFSIVEAKTLTASTSPSCCFYS